ncbi:hypothetical protein O181_070256 [Austropuccinia psidii MF-1]|uniref:Uncharacterized protein n=1 Tax=Austropuccinia psidii MF-1 TaxID=1389203 RepID=A0A9Q3F516_9BASI|nr:hypothetical protein [Austropuccinia psidii MF-1]
MDKKKSKLTSHLEELGEGFQKICLKEIPFKDLIIITKGWNPNRKFYLLKERPASIRENQATIQAIDETVNKKEHTMIPSYLQGFPGEEKDKRAEQNFFQPEEERVRTTSPEAVEIGKRSTEETDIVVNTSHRISTPTIRNAILTQNKHIVVKTESNINSNALLLQMYQFPEQAKKEFERLHEKISRLQEVNTLKPKTINNFQEDYNKLSKASEKTKKRLNNVLEEKYHQKRDREYLDQVMQKLFHVCQNLPT